MRLQQVRSVRVGPYAEGQTCSASRKSQVRQIIRWIRHSLRSIGAKAKRVIDKTGRRNAGSTIVCHQREQVFPYFPVLHQLPLTSLCVSHKFHYRCRCGNGIALLDRWLLCRGAMVSDAFNHGMRVSQLPISILRLLFICLRVNRMMRVSMDYDARVSTWMRTTCPSAPSAPLRYCAERVIAEGDWSMMRRVSHVPFLSITCRTIHIKDSNDFRGVWNYGRDIGPRGERRPRGPRDGVLQQAPARQARGERCASVSS